MYTRTYISTQNLGDARALILGSRHNRHKRRAERDYSKRSESDFGTKSYNDALQRAFNKAKLDIYFNPDMQYFVTLTYKGIEQDYEKVMYDLKQLFKQERRVGNKDLKYIYIFEWQKRGSLHVHLITNNKLTTYTNQNGYPSLTYWRHGFTSMLHITDFDKNFKPYLYLFKYMRKAQRIGKSFIHSSRNLKNYKEYHKNLPLIDWPVVNQERTYSKFTHNGKTYRHNFYRYYLKHDMLDSRKQAKAIKDNYILWQKVLLHSTRARVNNQVNHLEHYY